MALAITNSKGQVITFVRPDSSVDQNPPLDYSVDPPVLCTIIDEGDLPTNWRENASEEYKTQHPAQIP